MSEVERRRKYVGTRALIETDRILTPSFADGVLYFTGAQVELMRNLMQYANEIETYVSEYESGYYMIPDASDWDDLQAIVADLEETLMGNPNTIWGYNDLWVERNLGYGSGTDDLYVSSDTVPEGEIWILQNCYVKHNAAAAKITILYAYADTEFIYYVTVPALAPNIYERYQGPLTLKEGDKVVAWVTAPGDGKQVDFGILGYKMAVP